MKNFIQNSFIFILLFAGAAIFCFYGSKLMVRNKASFKIENDTKYIVVGHSHPVVAYNDSMIDQFQNFAISGEAYFYTFAKVKQLVLNNEKIEMVFLEFTNNQVSADIDSWVWDQKYLSYHYAIYQPFIALKDNWLIFKNRPKNYISNLPIVFKSNLKLAISSAEYSIPYKYGGYNKATGTLHDYKEKLDENNLADEDFVEISQDISAVQIKYVKEIIQFLKERGVSYCLIRSPQYESYVGFKNESIFQEVLASHFEDDLFLDLKDFPLNKDHFRDMEHMNYVGAELVSNWMNDLIKSGALMDGEKRFDYIKVEETLEKKGI